MRNAMLLTIGSRLGKYEIRSLVGRGGMGEVYRAHDARLARDVALKVLPSEFAFDPDRTSRFEREARMLAALDHPHIARIHSIEEADGVHFITMPFIDGTTLADRIAGRRLTLEKFYAIAIPLADAVAAAHQAGIVHRDLKPQNVMIGLNGHVTVLDFGLAKPAVANVESAQTELQSRGGAIVGTFSYMSPEQAEGRPVDTRSDIFSLGTVMFEMLTGRRPFERDSSVGTLGAIVRDPAPMPSSFNQKIPHDLERLIARCLAKSPARRIQTALDVRNELEEFQSSDQRAPVTKSDDSPRRRNVFIGVGVTVVVAIGVPAVYFAAKMTLDAPLMLDNPVQLTTALGIEANPQLSPDTTRVVFEALPSQSTSNWDIWIAQIAGGGAMNVTSGHGGADRHPSWSPDGTQIAFASTRDGGGVFLMPAVGGPVHKVFSTPLGAAAAQMGATGALATGAPQWSGDGRRLAAAFHTHDDKTVVVISTLADRAERRIEIRERCFDMAWSADGRYFACVEGNPSWEVRRLLLYDADGGDAVSVGGSEYYNASPFWSSDGRFLSFVSKRGGSGDIWIQGIDPARGPVGAARRMTTGLGAVQASRLGSAQRLAYSQGRVVANVWRVPILSNRVATWADAEQMTVERAETRHVDVSADGAQLLLSSDRFGWWDLWIKTIDSGEWKRLTADEIPDRAPKFSRDGKQIVFHSFIRGSQNLRIMPAHGGPARILAEHASTDWFGAWSPDGGQIAFISDRGGSNDIWVVNADGTSVRQLTTHPTKDEWPLWSKDGTTVIYETSEVNPSRLFEVPAIGGKPRPVTAGPARGAVWHPSQPVLYFFGAAERAPNIWSLDRTNGHERAMTDLSGRAGDIVISTLATDGRYLYFAWTEQESDIWVVDVAQRH
jgi:eukaryotic-like serine/threonine-protein kinase